MQNAWKGFPLSLETHRKPIEIASLDNSQRIHELSSQLKPHFQGATVKHFSLVVEQEDPGLIPALLTCFSSFLIRLDADGTNFVILHNHIDMSWFPAVHFMGGSIMCK